MDPRGNFDTKASYKKSRPPSGNFRLNRQAPQTSEKSLQELQITSREAGWESVLSKHYIGVVETVVLENGVLSPTKNRWF